MIAVSSAALVSWGIVFVVLGLGNLAMIELLSGRVNSRWRTVMGNLCLRFVIWLWGGSPFTLLGWLSVEAGIADIGFAQTDKHTQLVMSGPANGRAVAEMQNAIVEGRGK